MNTKNKTVTGRGNALVEFTYHLIVTMEQYPDGKEQTVGIPSDTLDDAIELARQLFDQPTFDEAQNDRIVVRVAGEQVAAITESEVQ